MNRGRKGTEDGSGRLTHLLFLATLMGKAALGIVQLATGAALWLGVADKLPAMIQWLVRKELSEDPQDFLAARLMEFAGRLPGTDTGFYTAHGLLHVVIVAALLLEALWAYPATVAVLAAFVIYQAFEYLHGGGTMLLVLSAIDIAVIVLTLMEWSRRRRA